MFEKKFIKNIEYIIKTRSALKSENSVEETFNRIWRVVSVFSCIVQAHAYE